MPNRSTSGPLVLLCTACSEGNCHSRLARLLLFLKQSGMTRKSLALCPLGMVQSCSSIAIQRLTTRPPPSRPMSQSTDPRTVESRLERYQQSIVGERSKEANWDGRAQGASLGDQEWVRANAVNRGGTSTALSILYCIVVYSIANILLVFSGFRRRTCTISARRSWHRPRRRSRVLSPAGKVFCE